MTVTVRDFSQVDPGVIRAQLDRILASSAFAQSHRRQRFLQYVVEETLAGRGDRLKGYAIGLEVFGRPKTFDPTIDPVVRIEAGRLRDKLREYYEADGKDDLVRIDLPKGSYAPHISLRQSAESEPEIDEDPQEPEPDIIWSPARMLALDWHLPLGWHLRWQIVVPLLALALLITFTIALIVTDAPTPDPETVIGSQAADPHIPAIAVLPFVNLSGDAKEDYFSDGLTEDILTELSRARDLRVVARSTSFQYKGKSPDVATLGRELKVRYVLQGSVRRTNDRVRVTAQLADADTGTYVWTDRFDREMADVLLVQDEIVTQIAAKVAGGYGAIERTEAKSAARKTPQEIKAYDLVLRARAVMGWDWTGENFRSAREMLNQAIALDPTNAQARRELAWFAVIGWIFRLDEIPVPSSEILEQASKAVQLDPADARARMVAASAYFFTKQLALFAQEADRALALAPYDAEIMATLACMLSSAGDHARGVALAEKANALNPAAVVGWYHSTVYTAAYLEGDYDRALAVAKQNQEPGMFYSHLEIIPIYGQLGRKEEALTAFQKLRAQIPNVSVYTFESWWRLWNIHDDEVARLMDGVHKSGVLGADDGPEGPGIAVLPFANLSGDPKQSYFSDGLTQDITTELARARDLRVVSTSSHQDGTQKSSLDVTKLRRDLNVRYILGGSVLRAGNSVRVTAQLMDAETGAYVWTDRFDGEMVDIFLMQDEIVSQIFSRVAGSYGVIENAETQRATRKRPEQIKAYDLVLRARHAMQWDWSPTNLATAKTALTEAVVLDPDNLMANRELAYIEIIEWAFFLDKSPAPPEEIIASAVKAVQLDPADARARMVAAVAYFLNKQLDLFEHEGLKAIELAPHDAEILVTIGKLLAVSGQWERGVALAEKAHALNADASMGWYHSTITLDRYMKGDYEGALEMVRQDSDKNSLYVFIEYIPILGQLGRKQEALENWRRLRDQQPDWNAESFVAWHRMWNMRDDDIAKLMLGIYKSGVLDAEAKAAP